MGLCTPRKDATVTDPAKYSKEEREEGSLEQEASKKLEENLKEDSETDKPKGPEEAKRQKGEEDPY